MNVLVNPFVVHKSVRVIESKLFNENANAKLEQHPVESRKLSHVRHPSELHRIKGENCKRNANKDLINDDADNDLNQSLCVDWLVRVLLNFVTTQKLWSISEVHDRINCAKSPVD